MKLRPHHCDAPVLALATFVVGFKLPEIVSEVRARFDLASKPDPAWREIMDYAGVRPVESGLTPWIVGIVCVLGTWAVAAVIVDLAQWRGRRAQCSV